MTDRPIKLKDIYEDSTDRRRHIITLFHVSRSRAHKTWVLFTVMQGSVQRCWHVFGISRMHIQYFMHTHDMATQGQRQLCGKKYLKICRGSLLVTLCYDHMHLDAQGSSRGNAV